jgi:ADP-heptose:LPS heptosyltransferase/glycosyltransferase involved in cell wall biosynthesis
MQIFYFVQITGRDTGTSGIPRVVRGLGRALLESTASLIPVRWNAESREIVYAEQIFLDTLATHNGPVFVPDKEPGQPISRTASVGDWLLIPEVPHLKSHDPRYPSLSVDGPIAYARKQGLRSALVFHDLIPLTNPELNDATDAEVISAERREFLNYARALMEADLVLPVSSFTEASLCEWLKHSGHSAKSWPHFAAVELPAELVGWARQVPDVAKSRGVGFVCVGTICSRKNQLSVIEAFNRLTRAKPDLPITLHLVGHVEPTLRPSFDDLLRGSSGRVHNHGYLSDGELAWLISSSRASIFVSKAEGYGLPIAESLWLGTPCLCSNTPPMVDIARAGGCLPVDPYDIDAIATGFDKLATDEACYRRLLTELAARPLKTWSDYSEAIVSVLESHTPEAQRQSGFSRPRPSASGSISQRIEERQPPDPHDHPFLLRRAGSQIVSVQHRQAGDLAIFDFGTRPASRRRLLVMKLDHIGDFVMALPSLKKLRNAFADDHITYLCGPWNSDFARAAGIANEVRTYRLYAEDASRWDGQPVEDIATFKRIAEGTFDIAIDLRVDEDTRFLLQHVDARVKCGIGTRARYPFLDVILTPQFEQRVQEAANDFGEPRLIKPHRFQSRMTLQTPHFYETDFSVTNTHVIFGPDLELPAGRFRATWGLQLMTLFPRFWSPTVDVDVARDRGTQIVNSCRIDWRQPLRFPLAPAVEFDNERAGAPHEFRVHVRGRPFATRLRFSGVLVEELGRVSANRFKPAELHVGEQLSLLVQLVEDRTRPLKVYETFADGAITGGNDVKELDILPTAAKRIVIAPISNSRLRDWGLDNYTRLAGLLLNQPGCAIILVGSSTQRDLLDRIAAQHEDIGTIINLAGRTSWLQTVAAIRQADLVISNNSGIAHVAAACGIATLAIYSASHEPQEWGPRGKRARAMMALVPCSRCSYEKLEMCEYDHRCMRLITPEAVADEAAAMLSGLDAPTSNAAVA